MKRPTAATRLSPALTHCSYGSLSDNLCLVCLDVLAFSSDLRLPVAASPLVTSGKLHAGLQAASFRLQDASLLLHKADCDTP